MRKALLMATTLLMMVGCGGAQKNLPIIDATLIGVKGVTTVVKDQRVAQKDIVGCYVTSSLITSIDASQQAADAWLMGEGTTGVIPEVSVDISACNALLEKPLEPVIPATAEIQVRELIGTFEPFVFAGLEALVGVVELDCKNRVIADAILNYVRGSVQPVIDELIKPDGIITIPAVTMDMKDCKEGALFNEPEAAPAPCDCPKCPEVTPAP